MKFLQPLKTAVPAGMDPVPSLAWVVEMLELEHVKVSGIADQLHDMAPVTKE